MNAKHCRIGILLVGGALSLALLAGCGAQDAGLSAENTGLKAKITQIEKENAELKTQLAESKKTTAKPAATDASKPNAAAAGSQAIVIEPGKTFTVPDFSEMTVSQANFTAKIVPPNKSGSGLYSYYEVKDAGNIYLDIPVSIKSLLTSGKSADEFLSVKVKYDGKYEYRTFSTVEDRGGTDFTYSNITSIEPLKSAVLHFIAELPKDASTDGKPVDIVLTISGKEHTYKLR